MISSMWFLRMLIVALAVMALLCTGGCSGLPTMRCKVVRLGPKPKADIAYRYRGAEVVVVLDVESVRPAPAPPPSP